MKQSLRILHLEDSPRDAELVSDVLESAGIEAEIVHALDGDQFRDRLEHTAFDVILCDHNIPGYDSVAALVYAGQKQPGVPVLMVSGTIGEEEAVRCLHAGAADYVLKDRLGRLGPAVVRAVEHAGAIERQASMERERRALELRFTRLAEQSDDIFWFMDLNPERITYVSPAVEKTWGEPPDAYYRDPRAWLCAIHSDDRARITEAWEAFCRGEAGFWEEYRVVRRDGSERLVTDRGALIRDERGDITGASGVIRDVTERSQLEAQFRQAQKMESVGRLAGGVAHDFNNLLTVINGMAELALEQLDDRSPIREDLEEIRRAGERGAALTRQLLAFSRKQIIQPTVLNLNTVVAGMQRLIERLLNEDIDVVFQPAEDLANVRADAGQIEQVLANLIVNARDAMPDGGTLTIESRNVQLDPRDTKRHGVTAQAGPYVMLAVTDTGIGMDGATLRQIFEPFFTTKAPGKGTGLGLSTVYGIVKQNNGFVFVDSEVRHGASFKIYLPAVAEAASVDRAKATVTSAQGTETILLVEDDDALRKLAARALESAGYTVLRAAGGDEALSLLERHQGPVHLLLTDVVMPGMNGRTLADSVADLSSGTKVLYTSGYTEDAIAHHGVLNEGTLFVGKPFTAMELLRKIREVLDS